jgi:eukaryotic-like serine/threonine-protein kinase
VPCRTISGVSDPSSSPATPASATPTQVGGRYVLLGELGRGGMATVHRAHDEVLDRQVAIKILHPHLARDDAFLDRFRREARAAAALSHPNVVAVHDWGETDEGAYLVLQLIEGPTLRQLLREHGQLSPAEAAGVLIPVARGLGAAHAAGMVHRDVKPENLLLGRDGIVRVTDFGLARAVASANATFGTDVLIGSPHYLAPEAVEGDRLDPRADVYALGVILFECLTGAPPHSAETAFATAMRHTTHTVPPPSSLVDGIPPGVDDVVRWSTAIDRGTRYPTGDDLARALGVAVPQVVPPMELDTGVDYDRTVRSPGGAGPPPATGGERIGGERLWGATTDEERAATRSVWNDQEGEAASSLDSSDDPADDAGTTRSWIDDEHDGYDDGGHDGYDDVADEGSDDDAHLTSVMGEDDEGEFEDAEDYETDVLGVWRRRPGWTAALVILGLILASGVGGYLLWDRVLAPILPVPDVQGDPQEVAIERLTEDGFQPEIAGSAHDLDVAEGLVLQQQPVGEARRGSDVLLVVSAGPRQVEVADVRGDPEAEAVATLRGLGFDVDVEHRHDEDVPEGQVVSIAPAPGSMADEASTVALVISEGPTPIDVPTLAGEPLDQARATTVDLGLEIEIIERRHHDSVPADHVIEQDPEPGSTLLPGGTIDVVVSDGPEPIEIPVVRDIHVDEAIATLENLGFEVEVDWRGGLGAMLRPGRVLDQEPSPGSFRLPGSTVTLFAYER